MATISQDRVLIKPDGVVEVVCFINGHRKGRNFPSIRDLRRWVEERLETDDALFALFLSHWLTRDSTLRDTTIVRNKTLSFDMTKSSPVVGDAPLTVR